MTQPEPADVLGVVLAGGRSSRMGRDKAFVELGGRTLIENAVARLKPQVGLLAINANSDPRDFAEFGAQIVADSVPGHAGPLAGILAGLDLAARTGHSHIVTVTVDAPFAPTDLVARLLKSSTGENVVQATADGREHPTIALWPVSLAARLRDYLDRGETRRVRSFLATVPLATAMFPRDASAPHGDPFFNINAPDDLALAARHSRPEPPKPRVFGIVGWKNSGKTTLVERLVSEFVGRGVVVSTVKHAHHAFDIDREGADSHRHRVAGATEVAIVSGARWALMHELRQEGEPSLQLILDRLGPCDLVLIEGFKRDRHPKIETRRREAKDRMPIQPGDPAILAIASDEPLDSQSRPVFSLDAVTEIADFIAAAVGLPQRPG